MFADNTIVPILSLSRKERKRSTQCYLCGQIKGSGKMFKCKGCKMAAYCCRAHQKADWKNHKLACKPADNTPMKVSRSIVEQFQQTMTAYVKENFTHNDFAKPGSVFRATKRGVNFHIHPLSDSEFLEVTNGLIPNPKEREQFEENASQQKKDGQITFVIFSTPTMAHAIVFIREL